MNPTDSRFQPAKLRSTWISSIAKESRMAAVARGNSIASSQDPRRCDADTLHSALPNRRFAGERRYRPGSDPRTVCLARPGIPRLPAVRRTAHLLASTSAMRSSPRRAGHGGIAPEDRGVLAAIPILGGTSAPAGASMSGGLAAGALPSDLACSAAVARPATRGRAAHWDKKSRRR